jgi:signal transduction histidine kinase
MVPEQVIESIFARALAENRYLVPDYAVPAISIEGEAAPVAGANSAPGALLRLAAATQKFGKYSEFNAASLGVTFYLFSREKMLAAEEHRTRLFGALIGAAVLAALCGLLVARRAFYEQHRLSEMKTNFVSSVSHELRAPIASIRLLAEGLERGKIVEAGKKQEYYHFLVQESRRLTSLIENVLDFSRIDQGRKDYRFEPTDLEAIVDQTIRLMRPGAEEKKVELVWQRNAVGAAPPIHNSVGPCYAAAPYSGDRESPLEPENLGRDAARPYRQNASAEGSPQLAPGKEKQSGPEAPGGGGPVLSCDGLAIQQALINLIDNAVKHSPAGAKVAIGLDAAGDSIQLWVEDHGPGIPPEEHEKIFERFYRRGSELRRETQGIGIGLTIVKHIVEAHGGRVLLRSAVGQGSRFTIELPNALPHKCGVPTRSGTPPSGGSVLRNET